MSQKKIQIFVSSTYTDLKIERQAAVEAILSSGHIPAGMELFSAGDESQMSVIERWIDESDVYLLILGGRYGSIEKDSGKSYIQLEYEYAIKMGKPLFSLVITERALEEKIKSEGSSVIEKENSKELNLFRSNVLNNLVKFWDDKKDIKLAIHETISDFLYRKELVGWIRRDDISLHSSQEFQQLSSELAGVKLAIERYRKNVVESNRKRHENRLLPTLNISGVWQCYEKATTIELFEYAGAIVSHFITGSHEHWLYGIWAPENTEVQTQIWRKENIAYEGKEKRITIMFGRIYNITDTSFSTELFASDGKADLFYDFSEHVTWKKLKATTNLLKD